MCDTTRSDTVLPVIEKVSVLSNEQTAPGVWVITLAAPQTARTVQPGQFVHLRLPALEAHILRRPFSVYGVILSHGAIEIMYQMVGAGTDYLTTVRFGEELDLIGPLGHGWQPPHDVKRALLVSGGLGAAPLALLADMLTRNAATVDVVMGAPNAERLVCRERIEDLCSAGGCSMRADVATDDGSEGVKGFSTEVSEKKLAEGHYDYVATCGPEPMQRIVASQAARHGVFCEVSLERRMACGIGVCLSCVVQTRTGLRRSCVDGPVFNAREVCW